jgi:hypothetical protein
MGPGRRVVCLEVLRSRILATFAVRLGSVARHVSLIPLFLAC